MISLLMHLILEEARVYEKILYTKTDNIMKPKEPSTYQFGFDAGKEGISQGYNQEAKENSKGVGEIHSQVRCCSLDKH